ncbi:hypothetical protein GOC57_11695 [Sinorhizobium meliloti]|nr:hypothetical protein [Sinorhizobium meliloti]MDW9964563.1 hypothetical protein [Sinorhizobium meliloti]MDX0336839.1 hypothetical protein [Sinorhizobium meliloti]
MASQRTPQLFHSHRDRSAGGEATPANYFKCQAAGTAERDFAMTTVVRSGMIEDGAFYSRSEADARFRAIFVGSYDVKAYEPDPEDEPWWLPCYGQTVLTADYPALFAKLGTRYGGNGTTTFGIPDARGRVLAGLDNMGGTSANRLTGTGFTGGLNGDVLGGTGGSQRHTLTEDELAAHGHVATSGTASPDLDGFADLGGAQTGGGGSRVAAGGGSSVPVDAHSHPITVQSTGGGKPHNNVQPTIIGVVCILAF